MNFVKDLLTLNETAEYLGMTRTTLDALIKEDPTFPLFRMRQKFRRVKFSHLQEWIDKKTAEQLKERQNELQESK